MGDETEAILIGKFIWRKTYTEKDKRSQINALSIHIKKLEKKEQIKSRVSILKGNKYEKTN